MVDRAVGLLAGHHRRAVGRPVLGATGCHRVVVAVADAQAVDAALFAAEIEIHAFGGRCRADRAHGSQSHRIEAFRVHRVPRLERICPRNRAGFEVLASRV